MSHNFRFYSSSIVALCCSLLLLPLLTSCYETFEPNPGGGEGKTVFVATAVNFPKLAPPRASRAGTVNLSDDDRLLSLRVIVAKPDGTVVHNGLRNVSLVTTQPTGPTTIWRDPIELELGTYDFYFIGNEAPWGLTAALTSITNVSQLFTDPRFTHILYSLGYKPDATKPVLYTRCYKDVPVIATATKGSQSDPWHFQAEGDEEVELIRTLAKVELTLKNCVHVDQVGSNFVPTEMKFKRMAHIEKVKVTGIPKYFSLFGNPYFREFSHHYPTAPAGNYSAQWYTAALDLEQTYELESTPSTALTNSTETYTAVSGSGSSEVLYDYKTTLYLPEHLRQLPVTTEPNGGGAYVAGSTSVVFDYNNSGDHYYRFSIWQTAFDENKKAVGTGANDYFVLPNAANYSKFSLVRNNLYQLEASEAQQLMLKYKLTDWCDTYKARIYSGPGFQVVVEDPKFTGGQSTVRVISTESALPADHNIKIAPKSGVTFSAQTGFGTLTGGNYEVGAQSFQEEGGFRASFGAAPAVGTPAFDIIYNGKVLYTVLSE